MNENGKFELDCGKEGHWIGDCECPDEEEEGCECGGGHPIMGIMCDGSHKKKDWWIAYNGAITFFTGTKKDLIDRLDIIGDDDAEYGELYEVNDERKN